MKMFVFFSMIVYSVSSLALPPPQDGRETWVRCKKSVECVVAEDLCHHPTSYNKKYEAEILAFYEEARPVALCLMYEGPPLESFIAKCVKKKCVLLEHSERKGNF